MLSVIIPVYNTEAYLKRCLDSVLGQTYKNIEVICVNDGSTDNSLQILKDYEKKDKRVLVIDKENGGLVSARKAGIKAASGEYCTYVDSDDWIEPNMYESMMRFTVNEDIDLITSGFIRDYGTHQIIQNEHIDPGFYCKDELNIKVKQRIVDLQHFYRLNIFDSLCNKIFRLELFRQYQLSVPEGMDNMEDTTCFVPFLLATSSVYITGKSFYHYCMRSDSILGKQDVDDTQTIEKMRLYFEKAIEATDAPIANVRQQIEYILLYMNLVRMPSRNLTFAKGQLSYYGRIDTEERVVVYGAGRFGKELWYFLNENTNLNLVAWADKCGKEGERLSLEQLMKIDFDKILVAVLLADMNDSIRSDLMSIGVETSKIMSINVLDSIEG